MQKRPLAPAKVEYNERYVLRPVEPADIVQIEQALQASMKDLRIYMSWAHYMQTRSQFFDRVVTQWWNYFRGDEYEMALFDKESGQFLVYTGFYPTARINPNCFEIGFWTASAHKGKGLATLATQIQIILIFEIFKGDRIEITSNLENQASLHIIKKCGFHYEGELRNFYPQGTEQMFADGYTKERRVALFSLIPEERNSLPWYENVMNKLIIFPVLAAPINLSQRALLN